MTVRMASISIMSGLDCRKVEYWVGSKGRGSGKSIGNISVKTLNHLSQVNTLSKRRNNPH